jgi:hypothetical protein
MSKDWQKLTYEQQKVYKDKAEYLLERGYVQSKPIEVLAKEIFERSS